MLVLMEKIWTSLRRHRYWLYSIHINWLLSLYSFLVAGLTSYFIITGGTWIMDKVSLYNCNYNFTLIFTCITDWSVWWLTSATHTDACYTRCPRANNKCWHSYGHAVPSATVRVCFIWWGSSGIAHSRICTDRVTISRPEAGSSSN